MIPRDRLLSRLRGAEGADCITMVAPAGYGKTTLLAEWADSHGRETAWVTLDERHDDPGLLIGSVAAAIDRIAPIDEAVLEPLASPQPNYARTIVPALCATLAHGPSFALVLDDAHEVNGRPACEVLAALAASLPAGIQLVVGSREEPRIGLGRLRAKRAVVEIGTEDMAMDSAEASQLFRAVGQPLERDAVDWIVGRTEGWAAALYLAAHWLEREDEPDRALERFTGDDRLVADYLREEFLARIDPRTLDFLIRVSILDRLTGDLCDAVVESEGSADLLRDLSRLNLLLVPLDRRDREYRFHALLREMLAAELHRLGEGAECDLHARASTWHAEHGDIDRAVDHAIAARDSAEVSRLIWLALPPYAASGRHSTLVRWLGGLSTEEIRSSAPLCLTKSITSLIQGHGAETANWATAARRALAEQDEPGEPDLAALIRLIDGVAGMERSLRSGADRLAEVREELPGDDVWVLLSLCIEGAMRLLAGDLDEAERVLSDGVRMGAAASPSPYAITLSQLALLRLDRGDVESAWEDSHRALGAVERFGIEEYQTSSFIYAVAALVGARRGDTEAARSRLAAAVALQDQHKDLNPWYESETRIAIARTCLLLDDIEEARVQRGLAARCAEPLTDTVTLRRWLDEVEGAIGTASADVDRWPLTPAEIRLLHHMPTHRSFPKIAALLFVSANTVKTQAKSIYRKFNVSSRAEAVACARAAGLLGDESPGSDDTSTTQRT